MGLCTNLLMAVLGLAVALPAVGYVWAPLRRRRAAEGSDASFLDVGPLASFPIGEWCLRAIEATHADGWKKTRVKHAVWVRRQEGGEQAVTVLSSTCPHLGCPVNWHPGQGQFLCPCHGATFDSQGLRVGGPPPRSMDQLDFEVRAGRLWVRWQDFKIGVAEQVPVSA
jgi:nitrite reductase/ring-hydroxylating ferredoxin subunit